MHSVLPAGCSQSQPPPRHDTGPRPYAGLNLVTRASRLPSTISGLSLTPDLPLHFTPRCLPSTILGPGLNLGFCNVSTGAQSSYLLTRLLPSTRRVVLPGGTEIPDEPPNVMLRARISEPTERESKSTAVMQRQEGSLFIPSALGPKSHLTQGNPTRAPNKGVWWLIYRQFFVSVTGVAGVT